VEVARQSTTSDTIEQRLISFRPTRRDLAAKEKRHMLCATIEAEGDACTTVLAAAACNLTTPGVCVMCRSWLR
jgi:hypothetical protein